MAKAVTITEALAELSTLQKRLEKKRDGVKQYLWRQEKFKDPLEREGGSRAFIERERQAIHDLEERAIAIRDAIQYANRNTNLTILGKQRTVSEWLVWRRDIMEGQRKFLSVLNQTIQAVRADAMKKGLAITQGEPVKADDVLINLNEAELQREIEMMEQLTGTLDGQLSLINATTRVELV